jgi:hypothetical protein
MDMAALAGLMGKNGWDLFDPEAKKGMAEDLARQKAQFEADAATIAAPFRTDAGKAALEALIKRTTVRPLVPPIVEGQAISMETYALYAARREGQNQVIAMICNAIASDTGGQPLTQPTE